LREYPQISAPQTFCWSPDGAKLVVGAQTSRLGESLHLGLVLLDLQSGSAEQIYPEGSVTPQCWSPDGRQIVYSAINSLEKNGTDGRIGVFDIAQKAWRALVPGRNAAWSPDGNWIAFLSGGGYYALRPSGEERKVLLTAKDLCCCLTWSPDSRFVAYAVARLSFMNPSRVARVRVRRLEDGSDDWVGDLSIGTIINWIRSEKAIVASR
jgi:WD40 repeat protein